MWMIEAVQIQRYMGHGEEGEVSHLEAHRHWPGTGVEARTPITPNVMVAPREQHFTVQPLPPGPITERKAISRSTPDEDSAACKHARLLSTYLLVSMYDYQVRVRLQVTSSHRCETQQAQPSRFPAHHTRNPHLTASDDEGATYTVSCLTEASARRL